MKKESLILTLAFLIILVACLIGCGGGGGSSVVPNTNPTQTSTPNIPSATHTPTQTNPPNPEEPTWTPSPGNPTATPIPGNTPTPITSYTVTFHVYDMNSGADISNAIVAFESLNIGTTDASGNISFNISNAGRVNISGNCVTRNFGIAKQNNNYECPVLASGYNTAFLRAIMSNAPTEKWATKPKFIIFTKISSKTPSTDVDVNLLNDANSVITELGGVNNFFTSCQIEKINSRPEDHPGISDEGSGLYLVEGQNAITICYRETLSGSNIGFGAAITNNNIITDGCIVLKTTATQTNLRHEIGHAGFGFDHPIDFIGSGTNLISIMNQLGNPLRSNGFSDADKEVLKFIYLRLAGNTSPDTDP